MKLIYISYGLEFTKILHLFFSEIQCSKAITSAQNVHEEATISGQNLMWGWVVHAGGGQYLPSYALYIIWYQHL